MRKIRVIRESILGNRVYNITYDQDRKQWVGGLTSGYGPIFVDDTLAGLLSGIGDHIEVNEGWAPPRLIKK